MSKKNRISTDGGQPLANNPFAALSVDGLPTGADSPQQNVAPESPARETKNRNRGRVDIIRQTAHRGGKTVTVAANFPPIGLSEKEELAKKMQRSCGVGGTVKDGKIEIQGDKRDEIARILTEAGFRPVFSGG